MIACVRFPFFPASIEERDDPTLKRQPLVLGGQAWQRASVYSMSQGAALDGVRLGLSLRRAQLLSPDAAFNPPFPKHYNDVSGQLLERMQDWTERIEPTSAQPAILYYADFERDKLPQATLLAREIGRTIQHESGLSPSIGLAEGKFSAMLAAKSARVGHVLPLDHHGRLGFLQQHPLRTLTLPQKLTARLNLFGIGTLGEYAALPAADIAQQFGSAGMTLYRLAHGDDPRPVVTPKRPEHLDWSHQFVEPVVNRQILRRVMQQAAGKFAEQLRASLSNARGLQLTVETESHQTLVQQESFSEPVRAARHILFFLTAALDRMTPVDGVDSLTIKLNTIAPIQPRQLSLFDDHILTAEKLDGTLEQLAERYGRKTFVKAKPIRPNSRLFERRYGWEEYGELLA